MQWICWLGAERCPVAAGPAVAGEHRHAGAYEIGQRLGQVGQTVLRTTRAPFADQHFRQAIGEIHVMSGEPKP